jgi:putative acetyltransferase
MAPLSEAESEKTMPIAEERRTPDGRPAANAPPPELTIRAARVEDFEALAAIANLPGVRDGTLRLPYQKVEGTRRWLEGQGPENLNIVAVLGGAVVGQAGFDRHAGRRAHAATLGISIHDDHRSKGIGTALLRELLDAADNWFAIRRLELTVYADNEPAIRLYERFGFEREGVARDFAFRAGRYADVLAMARLRP